MTIDQVKDRLISDIRVSWDMMNQAEPGTIVYLHESARKQYASLLLFQIDVEAYNELDDELLTEMLENNEHSNPS